MGFARTLGFADGNKRTGLACALVFLAINGVDLHVPGGELYVLTMAAATGDLDDEQVAAYFRSRAADPMDVYAEGAGRYGNAMAELGRR